MKSVVTGGAGFIGSHLAEALCEQGDDVVVLDNFSTGRRENIAHLSSVVKVIEADLSVLGAWTDLFAGACRVFHLAALADIVPSIQRPDEYYASNVTGTFNVLRASQQFEVNKFVYVASSSGYGIPKSYPTPEEAEIDPQYPYALTKRLGEEIAFHWGRVYDLNASSVRLFNVYGPRSRTSGTYGAVFGVFLAQLLAGEPLTVVGDGRQTRDFIYVSDVVRALIAVSEKGRNERAYNVGNGHPVSVNRLAQLLGGKKVHIPKRPGEPDVTHADISRIRDEIGWKPAVSIEEGVQRMLKNIEYWRDAPVWTPETIADATEDWFRYLKDSREK